MQIDSLGAAVLSTVQRSSAALQTGAATERALFNPQQQPANDSQRPGSPAAAVTAFQVPLTADAVTALQQTGENGAQGENGDAPPPSQSASPSQAPSQDGSQVQGGIAAPPPPPPAQASSTDENEAAATEEQSAEERAAEEQATTEADEEGADGLTSEEEAVVAELQRRDAEVRRHEQAHAAAGGRFAGAPSYEFERGPDGALYAVGGEVSIDTSPIPGDAQATLQKAQQIRRAALAPSDPSPQDQRVAAEANQQIAQARADLRAEQAETRADEAERRREASEAENATRANEGDDAVDQDSVVPQTDAAVTRVTDVADAASITTQTTVQSPPSDAASRSIQATSAFQAAQSLASPPEEVRQVSGFY